MDSLIGYVRQMNVRVRILSYFCSDLHARASQNKCRSMNTEVKKDGQLFSNPILEALTRTHIAIPLFIFYGGAVGLIIYSLYKGLLDPMANMWAFLIGFLVFTLVEYIVHRHVFHLVGEGKGASRFRYTVHGVHHDFPRDKTRLAMPPIVSVVVAAGFLGLYTLIFGTFGVPFTAGFIAGYATYLCVHYSVHAFRPPNNFLRVLWTHHAIHHYQEPGRAFGVSSPFWDHIFRTMPKTKGNFRVKSKR